MHTAECIVAVELNEEELKKVLTHDLTDPTQNIKCFGNCFFEKAGILKNGVVQKQVALEKLISIVGADNAKAVMEKCKGLKGAENCETAHKLLQCLSEAKEELKL